MPRACGLLGVRSPSKCGTIRNPSAPGAALSARVLNSSNEIPRVVATVLKIFAALRVHANGKKLPVASANPATSPDGSCVEVDETAKAVPLVPSEITRSPTDAPRPRAAPALSPAPAAMGIPPDVSPPNEYGATTLGSVTSRSLRSAVAKISRQ